MTAVHACTGPSSVASFSLGQARFASCLLKGTSQQAVVVAWPWTQVIPYIKAILVLTPMHANYLRAKFKKYATDWLRVSKSVMCLSLAVHCIPAV